MKLRLIAILASAVLLLSSSVLGITRAIRASAGYGIYHGARYGQRSENVNASLAACSSAYRYYPYNYNFAELCAEKAYYEAMSVTGDEREYLLSAAAHWCDTGLRLNYYRGKLRMLKARLMAMDSPAGAVTYWKAYVDWHYWEPQNHSELAALHAEAGDFDEAFRALDIIKGRPFYDEGRKRVNHYWKLEMDMPELP